ncbi:hypothetical protein SLE2022_244920 [Rubroshorea leprosula]
MAGSENSEVFFEEGMPWLPSQVPDEAVLCRNQNKGHVKHQYHRSGPKSPVEHLPLHSKSSIRPHHRPKYPAGWASGGPGMQALFLDSGKRSGGTGVFLPQMRGSNFQSSKKPACSPVLLPSRVVQALNLNVSALGLQVSPRKGCPSADHRNNSRDGDCIPVKNKNGSKDVQTKCCIDVSQNQSSSPEIFLPKEWTY